MNRLLLAGMLLAVAPPALAEPEREVPAEATRDIALLEQAKSAILAGKPQDALGFLDPLLAHAEGEAAKHKERIYSGQTPEQALRYLLIAAADKVTATDVGPVLAQANFWKAFALTDVGRAAEAMPFYQRAVDLAPYNPQFICELAHLYAVRKDTGRALDLYQRSIDNNAMAPQIAQAHTRAVALRGRGYVLIDMEKYADAEAAFRASLTVEPGNNVALRELEYIAQQRAHPGRGKS
jgi:tetratricopeptide (TPR) repeat protein